jgi:hypothetical protein
MKLNKPKKLKPEAMLIMLGELKSMIPTFLICNLIVLIICTIYCITVASFDWRLLTGLALGNTAAVLNFYFLGYKSAKIIRSRNKRKAQVYTSGMFFVRYFGSFILFGVLITFKMINPITVVVPLFFTRIHYTIKAIFSKEI